MSVKIESECSSNSESEWSILALDYHREGLTVTVWRELCERWRVYWEYG